MNTPQPTQTQVSPLAWTEWREACTIEKCSQETTCELAAFGRDRLYGPLYKLDPSLACEYCSAESAPTRAWLMMEGHLYAGRNRKLTDADGKSYKDMLASTQTPQQMEGFLTNTFKYDVARKIAKNEGVGGIRKADGYIPKGVIIKPADARQDESGRTLGDTLAGEEEILQGMCEAEPGGSTQALHPDNIADKQAPTSANDSECEDGSVFVEPETQVDDEKIVRHAERLATVLWDSWHDREKLIYIFLAHCLRPSDIARSKFIGCEKSQVFVTSNRVKLSLEQVDWGMKLDPKSRRHAYLTRALIAQLSVLATKWLETSEKREAVLSVIMDAQAPEGWES